MRKRIYDAPDEIIANVLGRQQELLYKLARDFPDLSIKELAERAGTTAKTVYTQLSNACKAIDEFRKTGVAKKTRGKKRGVTIQAKKEDRIADASQKVLSEMAEACEYFAEGFRSLSKVFRTLDKGGQSIQARDILNFLSPVVFPVEGKKCENEEKPAEDG